MSITKVSFLWSVETITQKQRAMKKFRTLETINTIDFEGIGGHYNVIGTAVVNDKDALVIQDADGVNSNVFVVYLFTLKEGENISKLA